jgi:diacylglycerol kinase (ATP)
MNRDRYFAIVNPAAGGGRCGKRAEPVLAELRESGLPVEVVWTRRPGEATRVARAAYGEGYRSFLVVGGDGTTFEVLNGLFPEAEGAPVRPRLALLPLGTGNSFLRDFLIGEGAPTGRASGGDAERALHRVREALRQGRARACDVLRLTHREGVFYFLNLLSVGFPADVAAVTNRWFKPLGEAGYLLGVFACLIRLRRRAFPVRVEDAPETDARRCLLLTFSNSKFTGGRMLIAPQADPCDGLIEYVRWGPIGRIGLLRQLPGLFDGSHIAHPLCERRAVRRVEFSLHGPVPVMVDGEVLRVHCERLEVLPAAVEVMI